MKKVDRSELVYKLVDAINGLSDKKDPAAELVAMGNALASIGKILKGIPLDKARAVVGTVKAMHDSGLMDIKDAEEESPAPVREGKEKG